VSSSSVDLWSVYSILAGLFNILTRPLINTANLNRIPPFNELPLTKLTESDSCYTCVSIIPYVVGQSNPIFIYSIWLGLKISQIFVSKLCRKFHISYIDVGFSIVRLRNWLYITFIRPVSFRLLFNFISAQSINQYFDVIKYNKITTIQRWQFYIKWTMRLIECKWETDASRM